jgi:hypothetical protein
MPEAKPEVKAVKLVCGVLYSKTIDLKQLDSRLQLLFGSVDSKSEPFDFTFTDYYKEEMGSNLVKQFYSFEKLIQPDELADIKNATISIEMDFSLKGRRTVNLDPGYLEESKLVLASTKNFSHRIYLRDNIWAEVTMRYEKGEFVTHPWTYADYSQRLAIEFLKEVREKYKKQMENPAR